jgi:hypothetical protein
VMPSVVCRIDRMQKRHALRVHHDFLRQRVSEEVAGESNSSRAADPARRCAANTRSARPEVGLTAAGLTLLT